MCTTNALYFVQINEETGNRRPIMLAFPSPEEMSENGNKEESKEPSVETAQSGMDREKDLIAIHVQPMHIKAFIQIHVYFFFFRKKKLLIKINYMQCIYYFTVSKMETESPPKTENRMKESVIVSGMNPDQITQIIR